MLIEGSRRNADESATLHSLDNRIAVSNTSVGMTIKVVIIGEEPSLRIDLKLSLKRQPIDLQVERTINNNRNIERKFQRISIDVKAAGGSGELRRLALAKLCSARTSRPRATPPTRSMRTSQKAPRNRKSEGSARNAGESTALHRVDDRRTGSDASVRNTSQGAAVSDMPDSSADLSLAHEAQSGGMKIQRAVNDNGSVERKDSNIARTGNDTSSRRKLNMLAFAKLPTIDAVNFRSRKRHDRNTPRSKRKLTGGRRGLPSATGSRIEQRL